MVLEHHGPRRAKEAAALSGAQVILTTYGTLLSDIGWLKDVEFDCAILDESQAVKNSGALTSKAARLLRARQRLALSGTPVENHLGELWSLMDFLNPGMLGKRWAWLGGGVAGGLDEEERSVIARSLRPFILRRTKGQVARELPERMEQTIYFDLDEDERRIYDELQEHYRAELLRNEGLESFRANLKVLEALLRLRQAACHPGLIDRSRSAEPSTKVDLLLDHLEEVCREGHKALVFSQFTTLLGIVKAQLDRRGMRYEYLDGGTRDRQGRVERFQRDPECPVFLISLRAGGVGLNLTMAEYVFLLDPWWNPAVEAQAIDRAHRIGQTRRVIACRLVARRTVEERVLELQTQKRNLAETIITTENSLIRELKREDLERLLG